MISVCLLNLIHVFPDCWVLDHSLQTYQPVSPLVKKTQNEPFVRWMKPAPHFVTFMKKKKRGAAIFC